MGSANHRPLSVNTVSGVNNMSPTSPFPAKASSRNQTGFSLVELMVGLTIGMLATVVIMQVFSAFETRKRATSGTDDAQTNGNIALYNIGREIQQAAYPLSPTGIAGVNDSAIECIVLTINGANDATTPNRLTPIVIADEVGSGGDSITIRYGDSLSGGIPSRIAAMGGAANEVALGSNFGCRAGDTTLIVNGATCNMAAASAVTGTTGVTLTDMTGAIPGADLACLGAWNEITYAANNGNLERTVATPTTPAASAPVVAGIVHMQAQYGVSAQQNSNTITQWVDATGSWATPSVTNRNRIKAVRLAVVARNAKKEMKNSSGVCDTTRACSSIDTPSPTGLCAWEGSTTSPAPAIDLSATDTDWQCYRYRVFETIIPLRIILWSQGTL